MFWLPLVCKVPVTLSLLLHCGLHDTTVGSVKTGLECPVKCRMFLTSNKDSLGMGVIKTSPLSHAPAQRLKPSRWISCASLMMAICIQEPEYCFLFSVSLENFDGIETIGTSLERLNCSPVLAGTAWWPEVWSNIGGHQLESTLILVSLGSGN